jgi:hypothetical protein
MGLDWHLGLDLGAWGLSGGTSTVDWWTVELEHSTGPAAAARRRCGGIMGEVANFDVLARKGPFRMVDMVRTGDETVERPSCKHCDPEITIGEMSRGPFGWAHQRGKLLLRGSWLAFGANCCTQSATPLRWLSAEAITYSTVQKTISSRI